MLKRFIPVYCLAFLTTFSSALRAQSVAYHADFKSSQQNWYDYTDMYTIEKIANGKFYITQKRNKFSYRAVEVALDDGRNYRVETVVTHISGADESSAGLEFAGDGENNNYIFTVSSFGNYFLSARDGGFFKPIIKATKSKAIKKGENIANKLAIETDADDLKLFINDQLVAKIKLGEPFGNDIGFIADGMQTAAFDYLTVTYLPDSTASRQNGGQMAVQTVNNKSGITAAVIVTPTVTNPVNTPVNTVAKTVANILIQNRPATAVQNTVKDTGKNTPTNNVATVIHQTEKDTVKQSESQKIKPKVELAVVHIAADTAKQLANQVVQIAPAPVRPIKDPVNKQARQTVSAALTQQVKDTLKQAANALVNSPVKPIVKDSIKKNVNQAINSITNQPLKAIITDTAFYSDFSPNDKTRWHLNQSDSTEEKIAGHTLKITHDAKFGFTNAMAICGPGPDMQRDFLMETEAIHYSGRENYGYGIEFGADSLYQYHFWITASGYYQVCKTDNKGFTTAICYNGADFIKKGDSVKNTIAIEHKAGQLYFFINNQQVESHPDMDFSGHQFGVSVYSSQNMAFDYFRFGYLDNPPSSLAAKAASIPQITITSPEVTRGLKLVQNSDTVHVAGIAKDPVGIASVNVNGVSASFDDRGNFMADVPMAVGDNVLKVTAVNTEARTGFYTFHITRKVIPPSEQAVVKQVAADGKYYALLIGEQEYQDQRIPNLDKPLTDAKNLSDALINNYTFSPENVRILRNPSRQEFFTALDELKNEISGEDNLLIFYAGHGTYDDDQLRGYWFPADAQVDRRDTWISNSDLIGYFRAIKSKHTLLISDACFSGSIFKSRSVDLAPKDIQEVYKLPSRKAMTSGAMKEVPDKSVFMEYLVKRLNQNTDKFLPSEQLFSSFKTAVINNSPNGQMPQFGEIRDTGDEGGDFVFIKKD